MTQSERLKIIGFSIGVLKSLKGIYQANFTDHTMLLTNKAIEDLDRLAKDGPTPTQSEKPDKTESEK